MLHEILLSLSGLESSIWSQAESTHDTEGLQSSVGQYVSPPEKAMLKTLSHLQQLHVQIRNATKHASTSHTSMVCRAVSSSVADVHLGKFMSKILEVESAVLKKDSAYVGAYEIVPLSTVVSEFAPWTRRLQWLWSIMQRLVPHPQVPGQIEISAALMIDLLELESHTGYSDIEDMALSLLEVAQKAWMRAASLWLLYGKLPKIGAGDFCIKANTDASKPFELFTLDTSLVPYFMTDAAMSALLSAGSALSIINDRHISIPSNSTDFSDISMSLPRRNLAYLQALEYPLVRASVETGFVAINNAISEDALAQILPRTTVMQFLKIMNRYMLLGEGEFAVALITHANEHVRRSQNKYGVAQPTRKAGSLDGFGLKAAELSTILTKALAEISALQVDDDLDLELLDAAKSILSLASVESKDIPLCKLLPMQAIIRIQVPETSPLHIFVNRDDMLIYSKINAYLLSIYRAGLQLSDLWKLTSRRRCHPTPLGPPRSASQAGRTKLELGRLRGERRSAKTRRHWVCANKLLFTINELQAYIQGEVIQSSQALFHKWLDGERLEGFSSRTSSRPGTASTGGTPVTGQPQRSSDPRTMAEAHRKYLHHLSATMFMTDEEFLTILRHMFDQLDHFVALFARLQTVLEGLDLEEDEGVMDAFSNYEKHDEEVMNELNRTTDALDKTLSNVVERIRHIEQEKRTGLATVQNLGENFSGTRIHDEGTTLFVPWQARTVDRLLMKLDTLTGQSKEHDDQPADDFDDE
jgi:hypothetical protein